MTTLYDTAKKATLQEIRALKVGDIIELYYQDATRAKFAMVTEACPNAKEGSVFDLRIISLEYFGDRESLAAQVYTDKFKKVFDSKNLLDYIRFETARL